MSHLQDVALPSRSVHARVLASKRASRPAPQDSGSVLAGQGAQAMRPLTRRRPKPFAASQTAANAKKNGTSAQAGRQAGKAVSDPHRKGGRQTSSKPCASLQTAGTAAKDGTTAWAGRQAGKAVSDLYTGESRHAQTGLQAGRLEALRGIAGYREGRCSSTGNSAGRQASGQEAHTRRAAGRQARSPVRLCKPQQTVEQQCRAEQTARHEGS